MIDENLTYRGNVHIKRDGAEVKYTEEQIKEYAKCMHSPQYFMETYWVFFYWHSSLKRYKETQFLLLQ